MAKLDLGLAPWLDLGRRLAGGWWTLAGPRRAQPAARRDSRVPGKILLGWNLLVILKLLITNLIQKTAKQLCFTAVLLFFELNW